MATAHSCEHLYKVAFNVECTIIERPYNVNSKLVDIQRYDIVYRIHAISLLDLALCYGEILGHFWNYRSTVAPFTFLTEPTYTGQDELL